MESYEENCKTYEKKLQGIKKNGPCAIAKENVSVMLYAGSTSCSGTKIAFLSSFGDKFMYQYAMKAPDEMRELHRQFYERTVGGQQTFHKIACRTERTATEKEFVSKK